MPHLETMIDPTTLVLVDKTVLSKREASNVAPPMGAGMDQPKEVKVTKNT